MVLIIIINTNINHKSISYGKPCLCAHGAYDNGSATFRRDASQYVALHALSALQIRACFLTDFSFMKKEFFEFFFIDANIRMTLKII